VAGRILVVIERRYRIKKALDIGMKPRGAGE
jgi:hypothetical protein